MGFMMKQKILPLFLAAVLCLSGCREIDREDEPQSEVSSQPVSSETSGETSEVSEPASGASSEDASDVTSGSTDTSGGEASVSAVPSQIVIDGVELPELSQYDNTQVTWGPGHQMDGENRPAACVGLQEKYGDKGALFLMPKGEKRVYLTFDEGYENGYTEKILDELKEKDCPAVFFVTYDYVCRNPELVQRMVDEGHVVGNHSMHHPNMTTVDADTAVREIAELHNYVAENFNFQMSLFRPPEGAFSERSLVIAQALGYQTALWSFAYADWNPDNQMDPGQALPKVTGAAHDGAVYLLHAVSETNTKILPDVIDALREAGYTLARLDEQAVSSGTVPSEAVPSGAVPSETAPSESAPSEAASSETAPSEPAPSGAEQAGD